MKKKKHRVRRFLFLFVLVLILLPAAIYFLVSAPFFIRSVVLPRVEAASGYSLSAENISFSPFSRLELRRGELKNADGSLTASFEDLTASYDLLDLLKDRLTVEELVLRNPEITLTPPLPATPDDGEGKTDTGSGKRPPELNLRNLRIENGTVRVNTSDATVVVRDLEFTVPLLRTGEPAEPTLSLSFTLTQADAAESRKLTGRLESSTRFTLDRDFALSDLSTELAGALRPPGPGPEELRFRFNTALQPQFAEQRIQVESLNARAGFAERDLLILSLSNPASVDWSAEKQAFSDTTLQLKVDDLRLSELNLGDLLPVKSARIRLNTMVKVSENGKQLAADGDFDLGELSGVVAGVRLDGWSGSGNLDATADTQGVDLRESGIRLRHRQQDALHVTAAGKGDWALDNVSANLTIHRIDLAPLFSLAPGAPEPAGRMSGRATLGRTNASEHNWDVTLTAEALSVPETLFGVGGRIDLDGSLTADREFTSFSGRGDLGFRDLAGRIVGIDLATWSGGLSLDGEADADSVSLASSNLRLSRAGREVLALSTRGGAARDFTRADIHAELGTADLAALRTLLHGTPEVSGRLEGSAHLKQTGPKQQTWDGTFTAENLVLPENRTIPSPVQLSSSGSRENNRLTLEPSHLSWPEQPEFQNRLTVEGSLDAADPSVLVAAVRVNGEAVDLTPWLPPAAPKSPGPEPGKEPEAAGGGLPAAEPTLPDLPFASSSLEVGFGHLKFEEVHLRDLVIKTGLEPRRVKLETLSFRLNEAAASASGRFGWEEGLADYAFAFQLEPLEVQPLVDRFLPEKKGSVRGVVRSKADLKGKGLTGPNLREHLGGSFLMNFRDGQVRLLDRQLERDAGLVHTRELLVKVVTTLARALRLPPEDLLEPPVTDIRVDGAIAAGRLSLEDFTLVNPELHLSSKGVVELAAEVPSSEINRMPVVFGVSTNLAKRLKIHRVDRVEEDRVFLPSFVSVDGTLGNPEIDVDKSVLAGLILSGVTERNDLGSERANEILRGLGGLLSGEAPPPTPTPEPGPAPPPGATPTPTPKPSDTERVLQGLQILRGLRATPTPEK